MRLYVYAAAALALLGLAWYQVALHKKASRVDAAEAKAESAEQNLANYRRMVEAQAKRDAAQRSKDHAADQALAQRLTDLQSRHDALRRALDKHNRTVERTDAQGVTCPVVDPAWGLCLLASASRHPSDVAACEASAGTGAVPDPVSH